MTDRVTEANKFLENGHKFMKTSLTKWTPDYDNAANQYNQAAMAFKGAGQHQKAIEANELAIKCYLSCQSSAFQAAKCMEHASLSAKELNDDDLFSKYCKRAVEIYRTIGQLDSAISTLERSAKSIAIRAPMISAEFYVQASELCNIEDRPRQSADYLARAALLFVKLKEFRRAANTLIDEIKIHLESGDSRGSSQVPMSLILVYLADKDIVGAMSVLKSYNFDDTIVGLAHGLVNGFDKRDGKLLKTVLSNGYFNNLDNEYAKIARDLQTLYESSRDETGEQDKPGEGEDDDDQLL